ncbi:hypothetical protein [Rhodococcus sp. ARC_M6]|uniref:hypothetical protein n=1 Tax=Rhodococcus sp. ARC_M6 TaxID=2928852 RepID=UPI001FB34967|nr:hypothetical protein [Rhodococcus sp. ARC_M6]MCJ0906074.1 hypothetical protein [Rhodococcus sp. ARC_M6]
MSISLPDLVVLRTIDVPEGFLVSEIKAPKGVGRGFRCLYREFADDDSGLAPNMRELIEFRRRLPDNDRRTLDSLFLWPLEIVESNGAAVGYITGVLPARFEESLHTPHSGQVKVARTLDWLNSPEHSRAVEASLVVEPDDIISRITYCAQIARAVHFLHSRSVVFGDIGPLRVVWSADPIDVVLLASEFTLSSSSGSSIPEIHAPGMKPPESVRGQTVQDLGTDRYKLAVLFRDILGVGGDRSSVLAALAGRIDHDGIVLFESGLGGKSELRPSALDWYEYFYSQIMSLSTPPSIGMFGAVPGHGLRNQYIEFTWHAAGYRELALETPWGEIHKLDISESKHLLMLKQSGQFRLTASNRNGTTERLSDVVYAFDPPAVRFMEVPELGGVEKAMTGLDSTILSDKVVEGAEFSWLDGGFDAVASPQLPPLPDLPQFASAGVALEQVDWQGLTAVIDDVMRAADTEVRGGVRARCSLRTSAAMVVSRVQSLASRVVNARSK